MPEEQIAKLLLESASRCSAREAKQRVPDSPGFYAIFVDEADALRPPFAKILRDRQTELIYIGTATESLFTRLVCEELHHCRAATFFRSIGAVCGFRPPAGSLFCKKGSNYSFIGCDTDAIIEWIEEHLSVRWLCGKPGSAKEDKEPIRCLRPLLNKKYNRTGASPELEKLRGQCRDIARRARITSDDAVEEVYSARLRELNDKSLSARERDIRYEQTVSLRDEYERAVGSKRSNELLRYADRIKQI